MVRSRWIVGWFGIACGTEEVSQPNEYGPLTNADSGSMDDSAEGGTSDSGNGGTDSGHVDTGEAESLAGTWGELSGDCDAMDAAIWASEAPALFKNVVDFGDQAFQTDLLSAGGLEVYESGNLGGSSLHSEVLSFEVLNRCEDAGLIKTEGQIGYLDDGGKKADLLLEIDDQLVGVSVTRAYHYPPDEPYTVEEGLSLLDDKLGDVLLSTANVDPTDAWSRSMLHVIAYDAVAADAIEVAHAQLSPDVRDSTLLVITTTDGRDEIVY